MPRRTISWPFGGRYDGSAHADQPQLFTRMARNVRNRCPITGRVRGASASGAVKWNPSAIGNGKVRALCSTSIDTRKFEFTFSSGAVSTDWDEQVPSKTDSRVGRTDRQGNVYALDGNAGLVKFNSSGVVVMKVALPIADPNHVVRALWVDESDRIFAGVSAGGDMRTARVWCIIQLQDNDYHVAWTLEPGAYTEDLRVYRGSQLYAAHNDTLSVRARVVVYEGIGIDPVEAKRIETLAYPIHGMDLREEGSLYCASAPFDNVEFPSMRSGFGYAFHQPLIGWKPTDDTSIKVWAWYDARKIDETDLEQLGDVPTLNDGQQVLRWRDQSGNNRDLYAGSLMATGETGPEYLTRGIGGLPSVRFDTGRTSTVKHSLVSGGNASVDVNLADQQRSAVPGYTGSMWAMFLLIRPTPDSDLVGPVPRNLVALENESGSSDHVLFINRDCKAALPGAIDAGFISYYATTDNTGDAGQCAATPQSLGFNFNASPNVLHRTGCVLITILWDGGIEPNDNAKTRCIVRYNGQPIDRFEGLAYSSTKPTWIGAAPAAIYATGMDVAARFKGEIAEMLVVERTNRFALTEPKVLTYDDLETGDANTPQTDNQITRIEAYLAHGWGCGQILPNDDTSFNYQHFYGPRTGSNLLFGPPKPGAGGFYEAHQVLLLADGLVSKHDPQGVLKWAASSVYGITAAGAANEGGYGWAVRARKIESDEKIHVWSVGPTDGETTGTGNVALRKLIDQGDDYSVLSADGAWTHAFSGNADFDYEYTRMDADKFGNLFLPGYDTGSAIRGLVVFAKDGAAGVAVVRHTEILPGSSDLAFAVALPPDALTPDYRGDLASEIAEVVYVFTTAATFGAENAVYRIRMVQVATLATGNPEEVVTLAVVEDDIKVVTDASASVPTGGSAAVSATAQFIQALRAGEDIVVLDGEKIMAYKLREGTVERLEATSAGEVARGGRARYAAFWRHRLMLALEGGLYAASRLGNIRDWNLNPGSNIAGVPLQTATQAFTGTITRAGEAEDSIVTMIPAADDLLFLVGSSRILRLTGDPQDGGQIHLVTDSMGGVFGNSWCKDDRGRIFMWGNKPPGLYQVREVGDPVPLSADTLEATEFEDIDYGTHRIELAWDPIERTVRIFQVAWATSTIVSHWAWEEKTHRLVRVPPVWQDRIESATKQPTAFTYLGGDDTRGLLIGCADGFIRRFDPTARDFDGTAVDSFVVLELTAGLPEGSAWLLTDVAVTLADDQEGCRLEIFSGETADALGPIQASIDLKPGRNEPFGARVAGAHLWARLRSANVGRWAFEEMSVGLEPFGMMRQSRT